MCKCYALVCVFLIFIYANVEAQEQYKRVTFSTKTTTNTPTINGTIFLSFANNIFGQALRIQQQNQTINNIRINGNVNHKNLMVTTLNQIQFQHPVHENNFSQLLFDGEMKEMRSKRGVVHLYNMVSCATGCNPFIYKGYGCYCGFLGSGYAVDGIDRCCQRHDWCYDTANCPTFVEYIQPYYWKCYYNQPICAIQHGEFGGPGSCAHRLCECDRVLSECLRRFLCPQTRALCYSSPLRLLQNAFMIFP